MSTIQVDNCDTCVHQEILHQYEKRQCKKLDCDTPHNVCPCNLKYYSMKPNFKRGRKNNA